MHNEFGTFLSPRISALVRPHGRWTIRVSGGRGYFAPTPFTEETEATGLTPVAPLGSLEAERADSFSADVTWARAPFEVTATVFDSRIDDALAVRETGRAGLSRSRSSTSPARRRPRAPSSSRDFIAKALDVIATHMYLWSTEPSPTGRPARGAAQPASRGSFDVLQQIGPARIGFEVFYTGRQALEDNPFRTRGSPHVLFGGLVDWRVKRSRVFVNVENLGDVRQTREDPLVRPVRGVDGRWTWMRGRRSRAAPSTPACGSGSDEVQGFRGSEVQRFL